jgi:IS30 family transposase
LAVGCEEVAPVGRQGVRLSDEQRRAVIRLAAQGRQLREIVDELGIASSTVGLVLRPMGGVYRAELWTGVAGRLSLEDRIEIRAGIAAGESFAAIGRRLGRATSTISREVGGVAGRARYAPRRADHEAGLRRCRPKPTKLAANPVLCARVVRDLQALWSPELIAGRLRRDFPDDPEMWVSHETIYKSLFVQGRGELRKELTACLRTGRQRRKPQGRVEHSRIVDPIPISQRPPEIEDRAVPGHWEGDLLSGSRSLSAIATLVERTTRFTVLVPLPEGYKAPKLRDALARSITELPEHLRRTLTWDRGPEMAQHAAFSIDTGVQVFFCDPRSPWQRGTNENTNGLLRQYLPKNTDFRTVPDTELNRIADSLNNRPRKVLDYETPSEAFSRLVASTG